MRVFGRIRLGIAVLMLLSIPVLFELGLHAPWPLWAYALFAIAGGLTIWFLSGGSWKIREAAVLGFVVALGVLWVVPWTPRKAFLRDLDRVELGMTRAEVEEVMSGYIRGTGWPAGPLDAQGHAPPGELRVHQAEVFRHSTTGDFDSDWGVVYFENDRVRAVEFLPD